MTRILTALLLSFVFALPASAQRNEAPPGFETGFLVLLAPGPNASTASETELHEARMSHGAFLMKLYADKTAVVVGPFVEQRQDLGDAFGMIVLRVRDAAEAQRIMARDASVRKGHFSYRLIEVMLPPARND